MDARHPGLDERLGLARGEFDADFELGIDCVASFFQATDERDRKLGATQRSNAFDLREIRHGQQAGDDRQADSQRVTTIAETEKIIVVVEQLCNDGVCAGIDFSL
jgi:hypothetical protein